MSKKRRNDNLKEKAPAADSGFKSSPLKKRLWAGLVVFVLAGVVAMFALNRAPAPSQSRSARDDGGQIPSEVETTPLRDFKVANAHEHLFKRSHLDRYIKAAKETGVARTLLVASSSFTFMGKGNDQSEGLDTNSMMLIQVAKEFPGVFVSFCSISPNDPDKVGTLKKYVAAGAKGLKLYTGHGSFHVRPLDDPDMTPVYAYCEETQLPLCWHVNLAKYADEFSRVMQRFPKLLVIVPHFGVTFYEPGGQAFNEFVKMMDTYPNMYTDTSLGTRGILIQGLECISKNPDVFREFCVKHSDRVLFGTDMVITGNNEKTSQWIAAVIQACRDVLEKETYHFAMGAEGSPYAYKSAHNTKGNYRGLHLDDATLKKIYETNFERLFPIGK